MSSRNAGWTRWHGTLVESRAAMKERAEMCAAFGVDGESVKVSARPLEMTDLLSYAPYPDGASNRAYRDANYIEEQ